jgi:hypothetical protein
MSGSQTFRGRSRQGRALDMTDHSPAAPGFINQLKGGVGSTGSKLKKGKSHFSLKKFSVFENQGGSS